ncbi:glycosyltransferase [Haloarcula sp. AONF1]
MAQRRSLLLIHHRDVRSPFSATVPHYISTKLAAAHTVHVICSADEDHDAGDSGNTSVVYHPLRTGNTRLISTIAFFIIATLYAAVLGARHRFDATYGFQRTLVQAWVGAIAGDSRFVAGLQVVPVRQKRDFVTSRQADMSPAERLSVMIWAGYAAAVKVVLQRCDQITCLTEGIRKVTEQEYGLDLSSAVVIGMGVDTETFEPADGRQTSDSFSRPLTVTYVGSLGAARGLPHVIEALAECSVAFEFHIAGDGQSGYIDAMQAKAAQLGVADQIVWYGRVPHSDVPELLTRTDVAISPLEDIESYRISFPAKLLEYMAASTVVMATDIPPHQRLITDGNNGILYDGTETGLCSAIERCLNDPAVASQIETTARETAEAHDWDTVVNKHAAVLFPTATPSQAIV